MQNSQKAESVLPSHDSLWVLVPGTLQTPAVRYSCGTGREAVLPVVGGQLDTQWAPGGLPACISLDELVQGSKLPPGLCLLALLRSQFRQSHFT